MHPEISDRQADSKTSGDHIEITAEEAAQWRGHLTSEEEPSTRAHATAGHRPTGEWGQGGESIEDANPHGGAEASMPQVQEQATTITGRDPLVEHTSGGRGVKKKATIVFEEQPEIIAPYYFNGNTRGPWAMG